MFNDTPAQKQMGEDNTIYTNFRYNYLSQVKDKRTQSYKNK